MTQQNPQVVITRKDKRINHKLFHAIAFAVTGGASGVLTTAEVANHAAYNARTRRLMAGKSGKRPRAKNMTPEELAYMKAHTAGKAVS
jgi:hypothetical protein